MKRRQNLWSLSIIRISRGMRQKELADRAGLDPGTVSRLENGLRATSTEMGSLAAALGVEEGVFLADSIVVGRSGKVETHVRPQGSDDPNPKRSDHRAAGDAEKTLHG